MRHDVLPDTEDDVDEAALRSGRPEAQAPETASAARRRGGWIRWAAPWIVAIAALAAAIYSTVQWRTLQAAEDERNDVLVTATAFVTTLTTWDAVDGLDDTIQALRSAGTGDFLGEIDDLFGGTLGDALRDAGARSEGRIQDVFVQDVDDEEATVFAVVVQEVTTVEPEGEDRSLRSARLTLEQIEGEWLVSRVDLINDEVDELTSGSDGSTDAPATGATDAPATGSTDAPATSDDGQDASQEGSAP